MRPRHPTAAGRRDARVGARRRTRSGARAAAVVGVAGALALTPIAPVQAGTATAPTSLGAVAVTVPDSTWIADECLEVPVRATAEVAGTVSWTADVSARRAGSGTGVSGGVLGEGPAPASSTLLLCPSTNGSGDYDVTVTVEARDYGRAGQEGWESSATGTTAFTLSRMESTTKLTKVTVRASTTTIKGRVTVRSSEYGVIGADFETVTLRQRPPGSSSWRKVGEGFTDEMGRFTVTDYRARPSGTAYRATFGGDAVAGSSRSAALRG